MSNSRTPVRNGYDVIVVGAGLGGLSAGALLAKSGLQVLVVDRQDGPGGYAHVFRRGPYIFDPAIHVIGQGQDGLFLDSMFRHLGIRERITLLPLGHFYNADFPGLRLHAPIGKEAFVEEHIRHFPHEAGGIRRFFDLCEQVHREAHFLPPRVAFRDLEKIVARFPVLFTYTKATLAQVLDECMIDGRAKAACAACWPYVGSPPSRLSFMTFTQMLYSQIEGTFYSQGSFQSVADALVVALEQHGGELLLNARVNQISVEDNHVTGVVLENGLQVQASSVISNADAQETFQELVGEGYLPPAFLRRLHRLHPSISACVVYAATTLDLRQFDTAHETFRFRHWDHEETYRDIVAGKPGGMWVNVPSIVDPSIAPPGEHLVILTALAPYNVSQPWSQVKERYQNELLNEMNDIFPGITEHLTHLEMATPQTLHRYTLNQGGALYGWEYTPQQSGSKRLSHDTPIDGLYLSGHWTQPGAASLRVLVSGIHTAQMVLMKSGRGISSGFQPPDLPPIN